VRYPDAPRGGGRLAQNLALIEGATLETFTTSFLAALLGGSIAATAARLFGINLSGQRSLASEAIMLVSLSAALAVGQIVSQEFPLWPRSCVIGIAAGLGYAAGKFLLSRRINV